MEGWVCQSACCMKAILTQYDRYAGSALLASPLFHPASFVLSKLDILLCLSKMCLDNCFPLMGEKVIVSYSER